MLIVENTFTYSYTNATILFQFALPRNGTELKVKHPDANFVFTANGGYYGMIDDFNNGNCDMLAMGREESTTNLDLLNKLCDSNLVFTDGLILENAIAFPIRTELGKSVLRS